VKKITLSNRQYNERSTIIAGEQGVLEGIFIKGLDESAVIASPHPLFGGSMSNPVINEIAYSFYRLNYNSLRFNYRGVDGSQGEITDNIDKCLKDYNSTVKHLLETSKDNNYIGAGYSFGSYITYAYYLQNKNQSKMILVSPPNTMYDFQLSKISIPTLIIYGSHDSYINSSIITEEAEKMPNIQTVIVNSDHFFSKNLNKISLIINSWIKEK